MIKSREGYSSSMFKFNDFHTYDNSNLSVRKEVCKFSDKRRVQQNSFDAKKYLLIYVITNIR